jgi:prepilin-type processing-associated H-X9-DG protein
MPTASAAWWAASDVCVDPTSGIPVGVAGNPSWTARYAYSPSCAANWTTQAAIFVLGSGIPGGTWRPTFNSVVYPSVKNNQLCFCPTCAAIDPVAAGDYDYTDLWTSFGGPSQDAAYAGIDTAFALPPGTAAAADVSGQPLAAFNDPANSIALSEDYWGVHMGSGRDESRDPASIAATELTSTNVAFVDGHARYAQQTVTGLYIMLLQPR